ncbi:MAG: hypothetical protein NTZ79_08805 [Proteobacteria bacterium]|nr:hypothetical protein [Pseudomonadota bacterium]
MTTAWLEQGDDDPTTFDAGARQWFTALIQYELIRHVAMVQAVAGGSDRALREDMLAFYLEEPTNYCDWVPAAMYGGEGCSMGHWQYGERAFLDRLEDAADFAHAVADARAIRTLDAWLQADRTGTLKYRGAPGGMYDVDSDVADRLAGIAYERQARWPAPPARKRRVRKSR